MAIRKVKKVHILGFASLKKEFLKELQSEEIIHLEAPSLREFSFSAGSRCKDLENALRIVEQHEEKNFLGDFFPEKCFVNRKELEALEEEKIYLTAQELLDLSIKLEELKLKQREIEEAKKSLCKISFLDTSFNDLYSLHNFSPLFLKDLQEEQARDILADRDYVLREPADLQKEKILFLLIRKEELAAVTASLRRAKGEILKLPLTLMKNYPHRSPQEIIAILDNTLGQLKLQTKVIEEKIKVHAAYKKKFMLLFDYFLNENFKEAIERNFPKTENFFFLEGWILTSEEKRFQKLVDKFSGKVSSVLRKAHKEEIPPTKLKNPSMLEPFEIIVNMYGTPHARSLDPTIFVTPFFFLFTGICISDAGYGIILSLLSLYVLKRKKLTSGGEKFFKLLGLIGISTTIAGAALGGLWGVRLPFKVIDIVSSPFPFLLFCFSVGFLQVLTGIFLRSYLEIKSRHYQKAVAQFSWAGLLVSLVLLFIYKAPLFKLLSAVFAGGILLFSSESRNIFARLGLGLYELYGITRYFSDVLSYSRLLALGMATGVIAMVVNLLAKLAWGVPVVGIIFAAAILIGGHLFNIFINLMSGFIHSARLQFVEFFSKFFELGGKPFEPLRIKTKHTTLYSTD